MSMISPRIAIVGAGMSGLTCAAVLGDRGLEVILFDKGYRPGGRLATRRHEDSEYDHGAQYFTVRDPRFEKAVDRWRQDGLVEEWKPRIAVFEKEGRRPAPAGTRRLVGVPGMNSIASHIAESRRVLSGVRVETLMRNGDRWMVTHGSGEEGPFDLLVVAVPAPQAVPFLASSPELQREAARVRMSGCWAVMVSFSAALDVDFDAAFVNEGPLSWIAKNGSKPGRHGESWVLHSSPEWTREHIDLEPEIATTIMMESLVPLAGGNMPEPTHMRVHRWRYAIPENPLKEPCLFDSRIALAVCGDWCGGPKIEGAYLSGLAAAQRIVEWAKKG